MISPTRFFAIVLVFFIMGGESYSQWTITVGSQDLYYRSTHEFRVTLVADIHLNGVKQEPDDNWLYQWHEKREQEPWQGMESGYGLWSVNPDGDTNKTYYYKVHVSGVGFDIWSNSVSIGLFGKPQVVSFPARKADGTALGTSLVQVSHYTLPSWTTATDGQGPVDFVLRQGFNDNDAVMRVKPDFVLDISQGFHNWTPNVGSPSYVNHNVFSYIDPLLSEVIAQYRGRVSASLTTVLIDKAAASGGSSPILCVKWFEGQAAIRYEM